MVFGPQAVCDGNHHRYGAARPQTTAGRARWRGEKLGLFSSLGDNNARDAEKSIRINHLT